MTVRVWPWPPHRPHQTAPAPVVVHVAVDEAWDADRWPSSHAEWVAMMRHQMAMADRIHELEQENATLIASLRRWRTRARDAETEASRLRHPSTQQQREAA